MSTHRKRSVPIEAPTTTAPDPNVLWAYTDSDDDMLHVGPHPRGGVVLTTAGTDVASIHVRADDVGQLVDAVRAAAGVGQDGARQEGPQPGVTHAERRDRLAAGIYEYWNPGRSWADAHPDDIAGCRADADAAMTVADAVAGPGAAARTTSDTYREVASRLDQFARQNTPGWARYCGLAALKVNEWAAQMIRPRTPDRVHTAEGGRTVTTITLQRHCPAGHRLGDATQAEVLAASDGRPLPDVRSECSACPQEASGEEQPS